MEVSSLCPTQLPGHMAVKWFSSTRTPLGASQAGQETPDTYNGAWRTRGAPRAGRTLQRKPRERAEEAQAPQSPGSQRPSWLATARVCRQLMSEQDVKADVRPCIRFTESFNACLQSSCAMCQALVQVLGTQQ